MDTTLTLRGILCFKTYHTKTKKNPIYRAWKCYALFVIHRSRQPHKGIMNTLNNPNLRSPELPIIIVFSLTVGSALALLPLTLEGFVMQLSLFGQEMFFNFVYVAIPSYLLCNFLIIYWLRLIYNGPYKDCVRYYCPLIAALYLLFSAAAVFGLYDESINAFINDVNFLEPEEKVMQISLVNNLRVLQSIVPMVMAGIAVTLITKFLETSSPLKHSN